MKFRGEFIDLRAPSKSRTRGLPHAGFCFILTLVTVALVSDSVASLVYRASVNFHPSVLHLHLFLPSPSVFSLCFAILSCCLVFIQWQSFQSFLLWVFPPCDFSLCFVVVVLTLPRPPLLVWSACVCLLSCVPALVALWRDFDFLCVSHAFESLPHGYRFLSHVGLQLSETQETQAAFSTEKISDICCH